MEVLNSTFGQRRQNKRTYQSEYSLKHDACNIFSHLASFCVTSVVFFQVICGDKSRKQKKFSILFYFTLKSVLQSQKTIGYHVYLLAVAPLILFLNLIPI